MFPIRLIHLLLYYYVPLVTASKAEYRLYREILNNYNKLVRPVRHPADNLKVEMRVFLQQIMNLDGKNQIVELNAWLEFIWIDYRLAWNATKFENVTSIRFAGGENQIWRPDILLYNRSLTSYSPPQKGNFFLETMEPSENFLAYIRILNRLLSQHQLGKHVDAGYACMVESQVANEDFDSTYKSNEVVYSTGEVNWVPPGIFRASCKMDITFFPFDDQVCHLKFGSWTYNGNALDLRIITADDEEPSMDLSTYTPSGEWNLIRAPAIREVSYSKCCPEPYSTVTFFMLLRRRSVFYLFNIVFPSLLISLMTLVGFCLPAHDMSEKIGYQTTILLSICFFVTIVSEVTPPTSESVPLLGMFFSTLTLIVAVSTTFTITVLHCRYRQPYNSRMTRVFRSFFLEWLPRVLLMSNHPKNRQNSKASLLHDDYQLPCADVCNMSMLDSQDDMESFLTSTVSSLRKERRSFEILNLQRKIGDGILKKRNRKNNLKRSQSTRTKDALSLQFIWESSTSYTGRKSFQNGANFIRSYTRILESLKQLRQRCERMRAMLNEQEDWKFAALALDRLCLLLFTFLIVSCVTAIAISAPQFDG